MHLIKSKYSGLGSKVLNKFLFWVSIKKRIWWNSLKSWKYFLLDEKKNRHCMKFWFIPQYQLIILRVKWEGVMQVLFYYFEPITIWVKFWVKLRIVSAIERMTVGTYSHCPESIPSAKQGCTNLPLFVRGTVCKATISH